MSSSINGTATFRAGGGAGGGESQTATGGNGGGGNENTNGTTNTGGGGGGADNTGSVGNGGSGIVILRYPNSKTITIGSGLTSGGEQTSGNDKYVEITAGTGNVSWS